MSVEFDDLCNKCKESIRSSIDFEMKKQAYVDAREEQKRIIIDALLGKDEEGKEEKEEEKFIILTMNGKKANRLYQTGSGERKYTANSTIEPYDLSNWKWISARIESLGLDIDISLQAFDIDPKTLNRHVLMDRIGLYVYKSGEYDATKCFENMVNTGIDLPMTEEKIGKLKEIIYKSCGQ